MDCNEYFKEWKKKNSCLTLLSLVYIYAKMLSSVRNLPEHHGCMCAWTVRTVSRTHLGMIQMTATQTIPGHG